MKGYELKAQQELMFWKQRMLKNPSLTNKVTEQVQKKMNDFIPERIHRIITLSIKQMVRAVLTGSKFIAQDPQHFHSLEAGEKMVEQRIRFYSRSGAAEGGITGAGGFLMSLADFPLLLSLKIKLLYDIAALYGYDIKDYRERIFLLYIFQLAFSSQQQRQKVFKTIQDFIEGTHQLPEDIHQFDWRTFQQQYRDYIDLAKLAQMIPYIGAAVGFVSNYQLIKKLGNTARQVYRMRYFEQQAPKAL
jgi:hypothetical protein